MYGAIAVTEIKFFFLHLQWLLLQWPIGIFLFEVPHNTLDIEVLGKAV